MCLRGGSPDPDAAAISQRLSRLDKQLRSACHASVKPPARVFARSCRSVSASTVALTSHASTTEFYLAGPASVVIVGYGQSNSYGGAPWKTSLAALRAHPLARNEEQAGYRLERGRLKCRAWAYTTPARSGFFPSFCAPPLNKPHSFRPVVREASKDRMIRRRGRTETATRSCACAKLPLGLGFHGCAHLSRVDNKVLFSRPCLGGYHWLQIRQLLRWRPMEGLTRDTSRAPTRPRRRTGRLQAGTRQIEVPRLPSGWLHPSKLPRCAFRTPTRWGFSPPSCAPR